jgi:lactoylglutathione lyase
LEQAVRHARALNADILSFLNIKGTPMRKLIFVAALCALSSIVGVAAAQSAPKKQQASPQPVITAQQPRVAYVAFRVLDLERSLKFYKDLLGMTERQRIPLDSGVLEVLLGYGDAAKDAGILLLHNPARKEPYTHGDGYHRYIVSVKDLPGLVAHLKTSGVKVLRGPIRVENLKLNYAFISDPDGYQIELVEND